jgi:thiol-disulfide isomerase/thioredoxin
MNEKTNAQPSSPRRANRSFVRRVVYPVAVILAIAGVIFLIEQRNGNTTDSSGQTYGLRDLDPHLIPAGAHVAAEVGGVAPDFELEQVSVPPASGNPSATAGGTTKSEAWLSDFRGHPVVLNFWATWCHPCRQEMPQFVNAYDKHKDAGLVVIGLDLQEGPALIQPFAQEFGIDYPILVDRTGQVGDKYRLLGLPTTVFIDANGIIQSIYSGPLQSSESNTAVQDAISQSDLETRIGQIMAIATPTPGVSNGGG